MRTIFPSLIAAVLLSTLAGCQQAGGDFDLVKVRPVAEDWKTVGLRRSFGLHVSEFQDAPAGCGTVHQSAVVGSADAEGRGAWVAIDATEPSAAGPNVIRINFSGKCQFDDAVTIPFEEIAAQGRAGDARYHFGPRTVEFECNGNPRVAHLEGTYYKYGDRRYLGMYLDLAVEAEVRFGETVLPVRIYDGGAQNGMIGTVADMPWRGVTTRNLERGDSVIVMLEGDSWQGDGTKAGAHRFTGAFLGTPVWVNGAMYELTYWEDGDLLEVRPSSVPVSYVQVDHFNWNATLVGEKYSRRVSWVDETPIPVPADTYVIAGYNEMSPKLGLEEKEYGYYFGHGDLRDRERAFECRPGETVHVPIGSPLEISVEADGGEAYVELRVYIRDCDGREVHPESSLQGPPSVTVADADGNVVERIPVQYSCGSVDCAWRGRWVPAMGLTGTFTVRPEFEIAGFEHTTKETAFAVE